MGYPNIEKCVENFKKEVGQMRGKDTCSSSPLRLYDPRYKAVMQKYNSLLYDYFSKNNHYTKGTETKDTKTKDSLNALRANVEELIKTANDLKRHLNSKSPLLRKTAIKLTAIILGE
ncbi:hypothetical protein A9K75_07800 [Campylobacter fetus subsp. testudinum]|uniref:hypothetical protein n=1 Tax=Campylobacter fetus TaxID=196 RepID=UPI000818C9A4|nr:hypothetical protein [Campylobacter fetus]OCR99220.1 hypothetical protein A9K75_07800 [Campylobacter fetus subsp. testudinum]